MDCHERTDPLAIYGRINSIEASFRWSTVCTTRTVVLAWLFRCHAVTKPTWHATISLSLSLSLRGTLTTPTLRSLCLYLPFFRNRSIFFQCKLQQPTPLRGSTTQNSTPQCTRLRCPCFAFVATSPHSPYDVVIVTILLQQSPPNFSHQSVRCFSSFRTRLQIHSCLQTQGTV